MVSRYKQNNINTFEDQLTIPIMGRKKKVSKDEDSLKQENEQLKRQLKTAMLKLEGYQIMGDILHEEYGIDLLKKSAAKQSSVLKNDTQKQACRLFVDCLAIQGKHIINNWIKTLISIWKRTLSLVR